MHNKLCVLLLHGLINSFQRGAEKSMSDRLERLGTISYYLDPSGADLNCVNAKSYKDTQQKL